MLQQRLPTSVRGNLEVHGVFGNGIAVCLVERETGEHLFARCKFARAIWYKIFNLLYSVSMALPGTFSSF
jgi:hypothetical protein